MRTKSSMSSNLLRVALDDQAAQAVPVMISKLKIEYPHLKLAPSRVASAVIARYFEQHFEDDFKLLAQLFFDSKEYLVAELPNAKTDDQLKEVLVKALAALTGNDKSTTKRRKTALSAGNKIAD